MGLKSLLIYALVLSTASSQSLDDPWLRDPLFVGLWKLTRAINTFGFHLFEELRVAIRGNVLICPYAVSTSLSILHYGSSGQTEKELAYLLGYEEFNLTKDEVAQTFYMLSTKHLKSSNRRFYFFDAPSTIVVNRRNGLLPTFQRVVEVLFQSPITVTNFIESADKLIRSINEWIAARTRNRITQILEYVDPFTDMVVLNAAYFKGKWIHKFPPQRTKPGIFYNFGSSPREVEMMHMTNVLNFHRGDDLSILELPFKSKNISMIILLPTEMKGLDDLQSSLNPEVFEEHILKMTLSNVEVVLPKFKIRFSDDLMDIVNDMGAKKMFQPQDVDFSEMIRRDSVLISELRHETTISVSERGVDTNANREFLHVDSLPESEKPDFEADHPFMFVIYERRLKMVLLMGRVKHV